MTTLAHLRKTALSLPETAEQGRRPGPVAFTTDGRRFASAGDGHVELYLSGEDAEGLLAKHATAERLPGGGVRAPLDDMNGQQLNHWLRRAWRASAPERLVDRATAAEAAVAGGVGDLPKAVGGPATRALVSAGITTLEQVADRTEAELRALHGVGGKAIRILEEALLETGRRLRS